MNKNAKLIILGILLAVLITTISIQVGMRLEKTDCDVETSELRGQLTEAQNRLDDWPELRHYAEANTRITPLSESERRVVFIGDSITANWNIEKSGEFFPGKPYINRGISGQITQQMLARFRQDVISLNPRAVVILGGTNDLVGVKTETTLDNLASMAEIASFHNIRVILASVLPVSDYGHQSNGQPAIITRQRPPAKIIELNNMIKKYVEQHGFTYLDYYSALIDDKGMLRAELAYDGLHPNDGGYAVMAPLAEQAINSALNSKVK
jgi:acyl-CoA thioesterase-1